MYKIGIILGSGLTKFKNELTEQNVLHSELGGVHEKLVIEGKVGDKKIVLFTGRNHFYETHSNEKVFRNVSLAKDLNLEFLIVTNAAGGLNKQFAISDLMLIKSHINFFHKPLVDKQIINSDPQLLKWAKECAIKNKFKILEGSYYASTGPVYETQSEINFIRKAGADAVGMSTIPDILKANELGIKTLGISCITNLLHFGFTTEITHSEVVTAGAKAYKVFSNYLKVLINDY